MAAGIDFDWHANELVHRKILLKLTTTEAQHRRVLVERDVVFLFARRNFIFFFLANEKQLGEEKKQLKWQRQLSKRKKLLGTGRCRRGGTVSRRTERLFT